MNTFAVTCCKIGQQTSQKHIQYIILKVKSTACIQIQCCRSVRQAPVCERQPGASLDSDHDKIMFAWKKVWELILPPTNQIIINAGGFLLTTKY